MIVLRSLTKEIRGSRELVINNISAVFPRKCHVAIVGDRRSGKSALLRLICGIDLPTSGQVERDMSVSTPVGTPPRLSREFTLKQVLSFSARVHSADIEELTEFVAKAARLTGKLNHTLHDISTSDLRRLYMVLGYAMPFDCYLFDEVLGNNQPEDTKLFHDLFLSRAATSATILTTYSKRTLEQYSVVNPDYLVLESGRLFPCDSMAAALRRIERTREQPVRGQAKARQDREMSLQSRRPGGF